jgi:diaminopimelate epimerase
MRFTKMHGLGNDFLVVDDRNTAAVDWAALARRVCLRRTGVGADGILVIQPSSTADLRMRLFNADGSEAEMCGNGVRCTAILAADLGWGGDRITWETGAGLVTTQRRGDRVTVDMGPPRFAPAAIPVDMEGDEVIDRPLDVSGHRLRISCVSMGNPHCVIVVDDVEAFDVETIGPQLETHALFPHRTNVEFVQVLSSTRVRQRTWERGVGETHACGTGACASGVVLNRLGLAGSPLTVELRGGELLIEWQPGAPVLMTGEAAKVFTGELDLQPGEVLTAAASAR